MRLAVVLLALTACRYSGTFVCESDTECRARGSVGRCEIETGFCLFNDDTCPSGFRYADSAGEGLASACLPDPPTDDAGVEADANTFDPAMCPSTYTGTLTGFPNAKYRMFPNGGGQNFVAQVARCTQDDPQGAMMSHAIVIDSPAKAAALTTFIANTPRVWIGLIQDPNATAVDAGWIGFTGEPLPTGMWDTLEPDDQDKVENHVEQVGAFGPPGLTDLPASTSYPVVCECDGRPTSPLATAYLAGLQ